MRRRLTLMLSLLVVFLMLFTLTACFSAAPDGSSSGGGTEDDNLGECMHEYVIEEKNEATCEEFGFARYRCIKCEWIYRETLSPVGHNYEYHESQMPTCTEDGYSSYEVCTKCNHYTVEKEEYSAYGHDPYTVPTVYPTCTDDGCTESTACRTCGEVLVAGEVIPCEGHTTLEEVPAVEPTCTEVGYTAYAYCYACNTFVVEKVEVSATGHSPKTVSGYAATCTQSGLTDGSECDNCGECILSQEVIPAKGHKLEYAESKASTCIAEGYNGGIVCSVCETVFVENSPLAKSDHKFDGGACIVCGETADVGFTYEETDGGYIITGIASHNSETLIIPTNINGVTVVAIADGAFEGNTTLTEVVIRGGVVRIEENAFYGCTSLKKVRLPATTTEVKRNAFGACDAIEAIYLYDFSQTKKWESGAVSSGMVAYFADFNNGLTPYETYLFAVDALERKVDRYTMTQYQTLYFMQNGQMLDGWEQNSEVYTEMAGGYNTYIYNKTENSKIWYINETLYQSQNGQKIKFKACDEYIRASLLGTESKMPAFTEDYFEDVLFFRQANGSYYLEINMNADQLLRAIEFILGEEIDDSVSLTSCKYIYTFDAAGYVKTMYCSVGIDLTDGSGTVNGYLTSEFILDQVGYFDNLTQPEGYFTDCTVSCTSHYEYNFAEVPGYEATCERDGLTNSSYCRICYQVGVEATVIPALGHTVENGNCERCEKAVGTASQFEYELSPDGKGFLLSSIGDFDGKEIIVPEEHLGIKVVGIANGTFKNRTELERITLPASITVIGEYAFAGCTSITEITIGDTVTAIGFAAFSDMTSLEKLTLPFVGNTATENSYLGYIFGADDPSDTADVLPEALKYLEITAEEALDANALVGADSIEVFAVYVSNVSIIPKSAKEIILLGGTVIPVGTFVDFSELVMITIPAGFEKVETGAFVGCDNLFAINMHAPDCYYEENCGLEQVLFTTQGEYQKVAFINGFFFASDYYGEEYTLLYYLGRDTKIVFPKDIYGLEYNIDANLFCYYPEELALTSVIFPDFEIYNYISYDRFDAVTYLKGHACYIENAARSTEVLTEIHVTAGEVNYVGEALEKITFSGEGSVAGGALNEYECPNLKEVVIEEGAVLSPYAFNGSVIESITLPDSMEVIPEALFINCSKLSKVVLGNNIKRIENNAFGYCSALTSIVLPNSVEYIGPYAFYCSGLYEIKIPEGVTVIANCAFGSCYNLITVTVPASVESIANDAFRYSNPYELINYSDIDINPDSFSGLDDTYIHFGEESVVFSVGDFMFVRKSEGCYNVAYLGSSDALIFPELENGETYTICDGIYYDMENVTSIIIPKSVSKIESNSFTNLRNVSYIYFNANITGDYVYPFEGIGYRFDSETLKANPRALVIGKDVVSLPAALFDSARLTSLDFEDGSVIVSIGKSCFSRNNYFETITLPATLEWVGASAFYSSGIPTKINYYCRNVEFDDGCICFTNDYDRHPYELYVGNEVTTLPDIEGRLTAITFEENSSMTILREGEFAGEYLLKEVILPDSIISIGRTAFSGCSSLERVYIGKNVNSIGMFAFYNCKALTEVTYAAIAAQWAEDVQYALRAFEGAGTEGDGITVIIKDSVASIVGGLFTDGATNPNIKEVIFEGDKASIEIGENAFPDGMI